MGIGLMEDDAKPDGKKLYGGKYETFAEWVKAEPDKFDDMDCRPGPAAVDEDYLARLTPEHMRGRITVERRRRRAEAVARAGDDEERPETIANPKKDG